jgi:hypothetical protein
MRYRSVTASQAPQGDQYGNVSAEGGDTQNTYFGSPELRMKSAAGNPLLSVNEPSAAPNPYFAMIADLALQPQR